MSYLIFANQFLNLLLNPFLNQFMNQLMNLFMNQFMNQFLNQFWNQLQYKSCYCSETYVNFEGNFWFLLLILRKMSYHIFAKQYWKL